MSRRHLSLFRTKSRRAVRIGAPLLVAVTLLALAMPGAATAAKTKSPLAKSPLSGGVLMAKAVHSGAVTLPDRAGTSGSTATSPDLTVLPNVLAENLPQPVNEVPITADPTNPQHLMSGGNDYNTSTIQGFYNSDDGGATWRHHAMPLVHDSGCGDPTVGYDRLGNGYIAGIDCGATATIVIQATPDNGLTWGPAHNAVFSTFSPGFTDKEWLEVDNNAGSPFVNCIYISLTDFNTAFDRDRITVSRSCNGGASFTTVPVDPIQVLPSLDQFSDLAIADNGTVFVSWMRCHTQGPAGDCAGTQVSMLVSRSTDGGATWSPPSTIAQVQLPPDTFGCYYGCFPGTAERVANIPVIDYDNSTGRLWSGFFNFAGGKTRALLTSSANGGATWTTPQPVAPVGGQGYIWTSNNDNGRTAVSFMHSQVNGQYFAAAGLTANGTNFALRKTSSGGPMLFSNDGFGGTFIGDYTGGIWTGNTFRQSWMDTRSGGVSSAMTGGIAP